jgi:hypothetical protein
VQGESEYEYDDWIQSIQGAGLFDRCESLLVTCPAYDDRDDLVDWSLFPRLSRLVFPGDGYRTYGMPVPGMFKGKLRWYEVPGWRLGNNAESGWPDEFFERSVLGKLEGASLEYLAFSWNDLSDDGVIALAGSEKSRSLRTLRLRAYPNYPWAPYNLMVQLRLFSGQLRSVAGALTWPVPRSPTPGASPMTCGTSWPCCCPSTKTPTASAAAAPARRTASAWRPSCSCCAPAASGRRWTPPASAPAPRPMTASSSGPRPACSWRCGRRA